MKELFPKFDREQELKEAMSYERCGRVVDIQGNLFTAKLPEGEEEITQNEACFLIIEYRGEKIPLKSEVIKIIQNRAYCQCFEDTLGTRIGDEVRFVGLPLFAELGPGLLGNVTDGLQNPLYRLYEKCGVKLQRGVYLSTLDRDKKWTWTPSAKPGDKVRAGDWLGSVPEAHVTHQIMVPFNLRGEYEIVQITPAGEHVVEDKMAVIKDSRGKTIDVTMVQYWPIKQPMHLYQGDTPLLTREAPKELLQTGFRIVDAILPVAKGGTFAIPGPFGSGKTVFQQTVSRYGRIEIIIMALCGERANEAVDTLVEFPLLQDPQRGGRLIDRTFVICNTSSMPTAARESSLYMAITVGEYYRLMGANILILADSTSRWAQALREMSARLEEIPGDEAFPVYIAPLIAAMYERAGVFRHHNGQAGSLTFGGTVSPAGGNLNEPVSEATKAVVWTFLALSRDLGSRRIFPSIDPRSGMSYSGYLESLKPYFDKTISPDWLKRIRKIKNQIEAGSKASEDISLMGERNVDDGIFLDYLKGNLIRDAFLVQNSYNAVDCFTDLPRMDETLGIIDKTLGFSSDLFESKDKAREFFNTLTNILYQRNYLAEDDPKYEEYGKQAAGVIASLSSSMEVKSA
ncbi:MAG: V-type ATP synthase subunit A [Desulfobacterales bacterium]|nr:V-type ATP synthase subunit A [Desulfobacterales bacterium]